jgi:hypothetical protein
MDSGPHRDMDDDRDGVLDLGRELDRGADWDMDRDPGTSMGPRPGRGLDLNVGGGLDLGLGYGVTRDLGLGWDTGTAVGWTAADDLAGAGGVDDAWGDAGWAEDAWGGRWPLGGSAAAVPLVAFSVEPDRPADVGDLASMPPGPGLARALAGLVATEVPDAGLVDVIVGCERLARWADALSAAATAELSRRPVFGPSYGCRDEADELRSAGCEVALALRLAPATGEDRVLTARRLVDQFGATLAALRAGRLDYRRARMITDVADRVGPDRAHRVQELVLDRAGQRTAGQHRRAIERAVLAVDPVGGQERHERAAAGRAVRFWPADDGMGHVDAQLTADGMAAVRAALDGAAAAMKTPGETRCLDQLRADALVAMARAALACGRLGGHDGAGVRLAAAQGRRPHIHVTVPYSTLIGLDEHPAELTGYGPIPASIARRIAADGTWRRMLTDPATGALLDYGTTTYQPPADLRDHVITRDRTCILPTCSQPAHRCQLDHTTRYPDGPTAATNLGPPCGPHHDLKTRLGWQLHQPHPGYFVWTTPTGKTYQREPEPIGPITEAPGTDEHDSATDADDP